MNRSDISCVVLVTIIIAAAVITFAILDHEEDRPSVKDCMDSVVEIRSESAGVKTYGTGFIIENNGLFVVTCAHVVTHEISGTVETHQYLSYRFYDSEQYHMLVMVAFDIEKDIAVLSFETIPDKNSPIRLSDKNADYGERIYIIGNAMNYGLSIKEGLISVPKIVIAKDGIERDCVMVSAPINTGDSGAPIIDSDNNVVGMASFRIRESGTTIQGMGYGVLSSDIATFLNNIVER